MPVQRLRYVGFLALRIRRMRLAQRLAGAGAASAAGVRAHRGDGLGQRHGRPGAGRARRRRTARARHPCRALVRYAACAAQLGQRPDDGDHHRDPALRATCSRKAEPARRRLLERISSTPSEAFRAPLDYYAYAPDTGVILERLAREQPGHAGLHARLGLARRRRRAAAGAGRADRPVARGRRRLRRVA